MRDTRFGEFLAHRPVTMLTVKTEGMGLRMQARLRKTTFPRQGNQCAQQRTADAMAAPGSTHRHAADAAVGQ